MSKKPAFRGPLERQHDKMSRKSLVLIRTAPLQKLLITVEVDALEEVSLSDTENRKTVC